MIHTAALSPCVRVRVHVCGARAVRLVLRHTQGRRDSCWRLKLLVTCIIYLLMWLLRVDLRQRVTQGVPPPQAWLHHQLDFAASTVLRSRILQSCKKPKHFPPIKDSAAVEVQKVSRLPDLARDRIDEMFMRAEGADGECVCARARAYRQF